MKMYVPFSYEKMGRIEVEANSIREAQEKAQDILDKMSWNDCGRLAKCVDDSAQIDYDGIIFDENQNIVEVKLSSIKVGMKYQDVRNKILKSYNLVIKCLPDFYNSNYDVVENLDTKEKVYILRDYNTGLITDVTIDYYRAINKWY